jgi:hypothetical protein
MSDPGRHTSLESLVQSLWRGEAPTIVSFQVYCTDCISPQDDDLIENVLRPTAEAFAESGTGRIEFLRYEEAEEFPDMTFGPMIMTTDGPQVEAKLTKKVIPPGFYIFVATPGSGGDATRRLRTMRSAFCAICGKAGAYHLMYEGTLALEGEPKLSAASNAIEMPRKGFRAIITSKGATTLIARTFADAASVTELEAPLEIFHAALDQFNLSARHLLYWCAIEALCGGSSNVLNQLASSYGTNPKDLDRTVPFRRLKDERDKVAHHGIHSQLSHADERVLQGIFCDLFLHRIHQRHLRVAELLNQSLA